MGKIVLRGYYGFGNFGDDVLMLATFNICKKIFPDSELIINTESRDHGYINKLIPGIQVVDSSVDMEVDWIIHGGGGVFFDFHNGVLQDRVINFFIKAIGYTNYAKAFKVYKSIRGQGYLRAKARGGLGIGIGTYTSSSNRFKSDILALSDFDILLVRDHPSVRNAKRYCRTSQIYKSTDLAFIDDYWKPDKMKIQGGSKSIGFILRDWASNNHVSVFLSVAKQLQATGVDIKFFSFDERADSEYISLASKLASVHTWKPNEISIDDFLKELEKCELVVSSRAHGAIISACLGIQTLCVGIEPKLSQVAEMLSNSSLLLSEPFIDGEILQAITHRLSQVPSPEKSASLDVARNRNEITEALTLFQTFVRQSVI